MTAPILMEPDDISPSLLRRLGLIVTRWAFIEMLEQEFLSFLLDADPGAMYVISQTIAGSTITDWLRALAQFRVADEAVTARVTELLNLIDETRGERNTLVHGVWQRGPRRNTAIVQTVRMDRQEVIRSLLTTGADLDDLIERIEHIVSDLLRLGFQLGFTSPDWRDESRRRR